MLAKIKLLIMDYIMNKLSKKQNGSVSDILADFTVKVTALHDLVDVKHSVMAENAKQIAELRKENKLADEEAAKATRIARTIASLIE